MDHWTRIRDEVTPKLWATSYRILNHFEDARDCVQDVLLEVLSKPPRQPVENWSGYLQWLVAKRSLDSLRRRKRIPATGLPIQVVNSLSTSETTQEQDLRESLLAELQQLPSNQATAFWMTCIEEYSGREVAAAMNVAESTVRSLVHRARQHLSRKLAVGQESSRETKQT